jgi:hypothetical protein
VGLEFDAPLTRVSERNSYRQSLIEYQQARRDYYQFRDRVHQGIRNTLRQLQVDDLNFELRRAAVHVAITQVDVTRLRLSEPARPAQATAPGQPTQPGGATTFGATIARDLVNAQIDLLNVQNDFLSVWVDHFVQTLQLDFDLGVMELDESGLRIDHRQPLRSFLENLPATAPPCECPDTCAPVRPAVVPVPETARKIEFQPVLLPAGPRLAPAMEPAAGTAPTGVVPTGGLGVGPADGAGVVPAAARGELVNRATQAAYGGVENRGELVPRRLPALDSIGQ